MAMEGSPPQDLEDWHLHGQRTWWWSQDLGGHGGAVGNRICIWDGGSTPLKLHSQQQTSHFSVCVRISSLASRVQQGLNLAPVCVSLKFYTTQLGINPSIYCYITTEQDFLWFHRLSWVISMSSSSRQQSFMYKLSCWWSNSIWCTGDDILQLHQLLNFLTNRPKMHEGCSVMLRQEI